MVSVKIDVMKQNFIKNI